MRHFKAVLFFTFLAIPSLVIYGQEVDQEEMMKAWQEFMTPGPMHELLASRVGEWTAEITMWMDPSQPPTVSQGSSVIEPIMGGRYFQAVHNATMMDMPFEGIEWIGYDKARQSFFSIWIDNMGTGVMYLEGKYDEDTKTFTFAGTITDPMGNDYRVREIVKHIDDDSTFFEMYMEQYGNEFKSLEINYTRKK
jgi:hypothetical protein